MKRYIFWYFKIVFVLYGIIALYAYIYYETLLKTHSLVAIDYEGVFSILLPLILSIVFGLLIVHGHKKLFGDGHKSEETRDLYALLISIFYILNFTLIASYLEDGVQPLNRIKNLSELKSAREQRYLIVDQLPLDSSDISFDVDEWYTSGKGAKYLIGTYVIIPVQNSHQRIDDDTTYVVYIDKRAFSLNTREDIKTAEYDFFVKNQVDSVNEGDFFSYNYLEHLDEENNALLFEHIEERSVDIAKSRFLRAHKEPFEKRNSAHLKWIKFTIISSIIILFFMSLALYKLVEESNGYRKVE